MKDTVTTGRVRVKSILTKSGIPGADYCINPYVGCAHRCVYCYADFMRKYSGHTEPWGTFTDAKENAPEVLRKQLTKIHHGNVILSSVTDPYQNAELRFRLTRQCLEILAETELSVEILTKSPLILRDLDILKKIPGLEAGLTVTTDDDEIRKIFEPGAPPVGARADALKKLHEAGIRTYAFIGPVLPMNPEKLHSLIGKHVRYVFIDRMNYVPKTSALYRKLGIDKWLDRDFVSGIVKRLKTAFGQD